MINISEKALIDLEFPTICSQLSEYCITEKGKHKALHLKPYKSYKSIYFHLHQTEEYKSSALQEKPIPNHGFESVDEAIKILNIEGSVMELNGFRKILNLSDTTNIHIKFFEKYKELYPNLFRSTQPIEYTTSIVDEIRRIIDKFGEIKNDATPELFRIRKTINIAKGKINSSFSKALSKYSSYGYLDDIRESVVDNVRVLAVTAMHKRKVKGSMLGSSKSGNIVYIQPEETQQSERELNEAEYEEKEEVNRILKALTDFLRPYIELLQQYQNYLSEVDLVSAKVKYAELYEGLLPKITTEKEIYLKDAFHPLLLINHNKIGKKTYAQDITLNEKQQIIVISGPNAGGKSITLKTIGLVQIMLQSGMLVPVHEYSRICFFDKILTDIGDNQSIENHLSTYSYRLKNMRKFLKACDDKTLFLIDEFGTGTDPELGGALAETFLEVFHENKAYGIITTHYANLKMMANENSEIVNANMAFDSYTMEPLFELKLGEAGSSFTFEVAQKNGIPYSLINRAKKKVERGKIRFDKSIAKLQMERSKLAKTNSELKSKTDETQKEQEKLDEINSKIQQKLENYQELYDSHQRMIGIGEKIDKIGLQYFNNKNKKQLYSNVLKVIERENSKRIKQTRKEEKIQREKEKKIKEEAQKKVEKIRTKKKKEKSKRDEEHSKTPERPKLYEGDSVRLFDGRAVGTIDKFEKGKVVVNYGMFTTSVAEDQLELVKRAKK
ncbi:endonuclease MutS2 [Psychroflexus tropicus]|uniref:endonuclease MutS2 n=1 Tax=Psychroflexus tropicus TaxID=197345 RepID=UPI00037EDEE4|nr:DNA mismatch repair protein MutS [Psychroflexus tropicus]